jgi:hypothetical protein
VHPYYWAISYLSALRLDCLISNHACIRDNWSKNDNTIEKK